MPAAEIFGPVPVSPWWLYSGLGCLAVCVLLPLLWWFAGRTRAAKPAAAPQPVTRPPRSAAAEAAWAIESIRRDHAAGQLTTRAAHLALSRIVRTFIEQVSGWPVAHMGLSDLKDAMNRDRRLTDLTSYVEILSPPSFSREADGDVAAACGRADQLIAQWAQALTQNRPVASGGRR